MSTTGTEPGTPLHRRLVQLAAEQPDAPALTCGDRMLSRQQLLSAVEQRASELLHHEVGVGDYVSVVLHNGVEHVVSTFASWAVGAVPQPLNARLAPHELTEVLDLVRPRVVVAGPEVACPDSAVHLGPEPSQMPVVALPAEVVAPAWKAPASGGSTGRPKVIVAGAPGVWERISGFAQLLQLPGDGGSTLVTAPLSHNGPFIVTALSLLQGGHVVLMPRFDAEETLRLIEQHRVRWLYAVPTMMLRISRLPEEVRTRYVLDSLEVLMHLAAPCPRELKRFFIDWLGPERVWELYAGTEVQAMTLIRGDEWLAHPGSVGRPVLGEIEIRDDEDRPVPVGTRGRVWLRRPAGSPPTYYYLGAVARADADGWETLGDIGALDADGYLYLSDRDGDMILVGGINVYPAEIEAALTSHPDVLDACVIGVPHEELGAVPHAVVHLREDISGEEVLAHAARRLAPHKRPRTVEISPQPLRDEAGKVRRSALVG